jgi:pimeloyl-ACP methyl ester carboxylesterase
MGAGVALNCALRHPGRVLGLVLLRPAWLDCPNALNAQLFGTIAQLLIAHGPEQGKKMFAQTPGFRSVANESTDSANSLMDLFSDPRAAETAAKLEKIPQDAPSYDLSEWHRISKPTLVLGTKDDPVHPFKIAEVIARQIPKAQLRSLTPKSVSLVRYRSELNQALAEFLERHFRC